jgi:hypothetical protein
LEGEKIPNNATLAIAMLIAASLTSHSTPTTVLAADAHVVVQADGLDWRAAPPSLPAGAQIAILSGNPTKAGPYLIDKLGSAKREAIKPGEYLPRGLHYRWTSEDTVIESHSTEPSGIAHVNLADDPRQQTQ